MPDPPPATGSSNDGVDVTTRHWLVSMCDLSPSIEKSAKLVLDPHKEELSATTDGGAEINWCRLRLSFPLGKRIKVGDWITASSYGKGVSPTAWPPCLVVDTVVFGNHRGIFYRQDAAYGGSSVAWKTFRNKAEDTGMSAKIT